MQAILIAGPTASGKSALALELAARVNGFVVNADSMQVYRDLRIITARPTPEDEALAPHALYGTVDGGENFSVSRWLAAAAEVLAAARTLGNLPIFVGGTGLYFKALTQGLSDIPAVPDAIRNDVRTWARGREPSALHEELSQRDPATAARLRPTDPQRILRAIEVHEATGKSLSSFHDRRERPALNVENCVALTVAIDRAILRPRIDARLDAMITSSGLDEVEGLAARQLEPTLPVMRAIGVPPLLRYLSGTLSLEAAVIEAKMASRHYIKRQETFVRHQLPGFRATPAEDAETLLTEACQSL